MSALPDRDQQLIDRATARVRRIKRVMRASGAAYDLARSGAESTRGYGQYLVRAGREHERRGRLRELLILWCRELLQAGATDEEFLAAIESTDSEVTR